MYNKIYMGTCFCGLRSHINTPLAFISGDEHMHADGLNDMVGRNIQCLEYEGQWNIGQSLEPIYFENYDYETFQYFYHPDHLGSSSFITDMNGYAEQHTMCRSIFYGVLQTNLCSTNTNKIQVGIQYLPFGELLVED